LLRTGGLFFLGPVLGSHSKNKVWG
jgi:hypothetical protein